MNNIQDNKQFLTLLDKVPASFFITDKNATILYSNQAQEKKTGFAKAEIVGKRPGQLWGRQMPPSFYRTLWDVLANKKKIFVSAVQNKRKTGETYHETIRLAPVFHHEEIQYFIALNFAGKNSQFFQKEFAEVMTKSQTNAKIFRERLSHWFGIDLPPVIMENQTLSEFLSTYFVQPTTDIYHNRHEDTSLLLEVKKETSLFSALYEKYYKTVLDYFLRRVEYQRSLAEDLTQETFLRAFAHVSEFTITNASYKTYLLRIAHNLLVNHYRNTLFTIPDEAAYELPDTRPSTVSFDYRLETALQKLSRVEHEAIRLMYHEGYSVREIAEMLDKSENAIKLHLSRARRKLRELLQIP